ncbi:DUF418 domain-containing protein [Nocardiopsis metallicus]|uniref:DUF418 domain-containing protein n=1 Tax=Nocardiopsis metallicus TaxID=179819 RepID=UPI0031D52565
MAAPRLLAPDFARGGMLLLILLSNTAFFLYAGDYTRSDNYPDPTSVADSVTQFLMLALLDVRVYPLFAFLVGYGIVQTLTRRMAAGATQDEAAATIRSRNRWLFAFGFVHAALLLSTEVLAAYGLIGLVLCALFLRGSERRLRAGILTGVGLLALVFAAGAAALALITVLSPAGEAVALTDGGARYLLSGAAEENYLVSVLFRLPTWVVLLFINGFGVVLPTAILIGMWAARHRVLEEPERHRTLIRRVAVIGTALGLAGALPGALKHVGAFDPAPYYGLSDTAMTLTAWTSGLAGGLGYVALFVLLSGFLTRRGRPPVVVTSVAALGKRSLSGYLSHSIVLVPVLSAWGLGLGAHLTSFTMALFALGLWLVTVVVAALMERGGRRGPFEVLLRRLSLRKRPRQLSGR